MTRCGIFGPSECGKTTLAKQLSKQYWTREKIPTLVLDPWIEKDGSWGDHAWGTSNEDEFWKRVWSCDKHLVIVDDASATISRNRELIPVFTTLRHHHHKLIVIGHSGTDLLPDMRRNINTLYLFKQTKKACNVWIEDMVEDRLSEAQQLGQYEFLMYQRFGVPKKFKTKPPISA